MFEKGQKKTGGRAKGKKNIAATDLKIMILKALHEAGAEDYFVKQAEENPVAFMSMVAKLLPREINAKVEDTSIASLLKERIAYAEKFAADNESTGDGRKVQQHQPLLGHDGRYLPA